MTASDITLATLEDAKEIALNNIAMSKETENLEIPDEIMNNGVLKLLEDKGKGHYYVIKGPDGAVIAQLMITFEWSDWRCAQIWWIQSVYVRPAHRRQGLFKALYRHAKQESVAAGACGLRLYADDGNTNAQSVELSLTSTSVASAVVILAEKPNKTVPRSEATPKAVQDAKDTLANLCIIQNEDATPDQQFVLPITANQEYGFFHSPLVQPSPLFHHPKNMCDVCKYSDAYYTMTGKSPYASKGPAA